MSFQCAYVERDSATYVNDFALGVLPRNPAAQKLSRGHMGYTQIQ